ncbi:GtrA family protein [Cupriavidus sp. P-10]|uniref:GtrA family protein n=1 Tax=Cupriavidus sp. P-10 TaxID=2027911 RepID=UPI000E2EE50A|nr:GtrA family protein [Cupriavidus sp. P-10]
MRFARFIVAGASATAVHYLTLITLVHYGAATLLSSVVGSVAGMVTHYRLSSRWVFAQGERRGSRLGRFLAVASVAFALNSVFVWLGLSLGLHYLLAQISSTLLVMVINYALHTNWTFIHGEVR